MMGSRSTFLVNGLRGDVYYPVNKFVLDIIPPEKGLSTLDDKTGQWKLNPVLSQINKTFTARLSVFADPSLGAEGVTVKVWTFTVKRWEKYFATTAIWKSQYQQQSMVHANGYSSEYTVGTSYTLRAPTDFLVSTALFQHYEGGDDSRIVYSWWFDQISPTNVTNKKLKFYIDSKGTPPLAPATTLFLALLLWQFRFPG
jgi:hypothetical protein